jgi:phosphotriesterase-related protein
MARVNTVTGPIDSADLGFTLMHEHLLIGWAGWQWDSKFKFDRAEAMARSVDRLQALKANGVSTFVDPCPMDIGRDPAFMQEAASKAGMQFIAATGFYHSELGYLPYYHGRSEEEIAEIFVDELTQGMAGTDIKAGIIKCANNAHVNEGDEKVLRAAGRAALATGAPIITHNSPHEPVGRKQLECFADAGLSANRVAIGHACGTGDMQYYFDILEKGAFLSFDQFGLGLVAPDELRIASLVGLLGLGHSGRILLSHDSVCYFLGRGFDFPPDVQETIKDWNPLHLIKDIFPRLKQAGVSQAQIDEMTVTNPRRVFESAGA